jgi:hypothetical protein
MGDFDDLRLDRPPAVPPPARPGLLPLIVAAVLLLALAGLWYYLRRESEAERAARIATEQVVPRAEEKPAGEAAPTVDLPPLQESDAFVRELVQALSQHPIVAAWLTSDQLIRTFTVSVMNVAEGGTPAGHLYTIRPEGSFQTRRKAGRTYIDPRSYARFDGHAAAVAGLDPAGAARLYSTLKPRIDEAYRQLAGPDGDFDRTLKRAIVELLETPVVEGEVAVEARIAGFAYADPSLESLSAAQQQLLRMGPANVRLVRDKLRAVALQLGISEAELPAERTIRPGG